MLLPTMFLSVVFLVWAGRSIEQGKSDNGDFKWNYRFIVSARILIGVFFMIATVGSANSQ
jgi:hypothetical protein